MEDFSLLKSFSISIHPPKPYAIKKVLWYPPQPDTIKCNIDGGAKKAPEHARCGHIFNDHCGADLGCFA